MPKKGGKGKQAAMTEEERLLYMQQKAQAEEEMAKRKEDMLTQFLKVQACLLYLTEMANVFHALGRR